MRSGVAIALALGIISGCGGKVLDGTCTAEDGGSEWSCADASGIPPVANQCPAGFRNACSSSNGLVGFQTVGGGGAGNLAADCLDCGSNGIGTYWTCTGQGWRAAGSYTCQQ